MELRDRYYTNTKQMIEQLYTQNNNTPIVLLCHSMGCKVAHYFLNFIADNYNQSWIDQYIHTYVSLYIYIYTQCSLVSPNIHFYHYGFLKLF